MRITITVRTPKINHHLEKVEILLPKMFPKKFKSEKSGVAFVRGYRHDQQRGENAANKDEMDEKAEEELLRYERVKDKENTQ
jgi:hypothetical protein